MPRHDDPVLRARTTIIELMKAADGARRAMTRALEPFDLTLPQFNVLTILFHHTELPTFQIAARMVENTPGITRLVSTLETKGYVRRGQSATDRRQQLCSLTAAGRNVVKRAVPGFSEAQQELVAALKASEAEQLQVLLGRITARRVSAVRELSPAQGAHSPSSPQAPVASHDRARRRRSA